MTMATNFPLWNSIRPGQHWVLDSSGDVQVQAKNKLSICQIFSGCNSLANNIHAMAKLILVDYSGRVLSPDESRQLSELKGKVEEKVHHYNESHWCIYHLVMKLFGRDANAAQKKFDDALVTIDNFQTNKIAPSPARSHLDLHLSLQRKE